MRGELETPFYKITEWEKRCWEEKRSVVHQILSDKDVATSKACAYVAENSTFNSREGRRTSSAPSN